MTIAILLVSLSVGIAYATSTEITRSVPGHVAINVIRIQESLDVNGDGRIDEGDLAAIARKLGAQAEPGAREDVNGDGTIDSLDLALVASYFDQEV